MLQQNTPSDSEGDSSISNLSGGTSSGGGGGY